MQELRFFCFARRLMLIDIYMKFLDILNRLQVTEQTRFCDKVPREITQKVYRQEARVMVPVLCMSSNVD